MFNPQDTIKELWIKGYKRAAYWKLCIYSPTNPNRQLSGQPNYPLGIFTHLLN